MSEPKVKVMSKTPVVYITTDVYVALLRFFGASTSERFAYLHGNVDNVEQRVEVVDISIPPQKSSAASVEPDLDSDKYFDWHTAMFEKARVHPIVGIVHSFSGGAHHSARDENTDALLGETSKDAGREFLISITVSAGKTLGRRDFRVDVVWTPNTHKFQMAWEDVSWWYMHDEAHVLSMIEGAEDMVETAVYLAPEKKPETETGTWTKKSTIVSSADSDLYQKTVNFEYDKVKVSRNTGKPIAIDFWNSDTKRYEHIDVVSSKRWALINGNEVSLDNGYHDWTWSPVTQTFEGRSTAKMLNLLLNGRIHKIDMLSPGFQYPSTALEYISRMAPEHKVESELNKGAKKASTPKKRGRKKGKKQQEKGEARRIPWFTDNTNEKTLQCSAMALVVETLEESTSQAVDVAEDAIRADIIEFFTLKESEGAVSPLPPSGDNRDPSEHSHERVCVDDGQFIIHEMLRLNEWWQSTTTGLWQRIGMVKESDGTMRAKYLYVIEPETGRVIEFNREDGPQYPEAVVDFMSNDVAEIYYGVVEAETEEEDEASTPPDGTEIEKLSDEDKEKVREAIIGGD